MLEDLSQKLDGLVGKYKEEIAGIRTGRASSLLVENIAVSCYNSKMTIKELASISVPDVKLILIEPWDKSIINDIDKAIQLSGLGLSPNNDGNVIRVALPSLTTERRAQLVKTLKAKQEEIRIEMRKVREEERNLIKKTEKDGNISEDEKFRLDKKLQDEVDKTGELIKKMTEDKEKEIMTI